MDLEMLFIQTDVYVEDEDVSNAYGVLAGGFSFNWNICASQNVIDFSQFLGGLVNMTNKKYGNQHLVWFSGRSLLTQWHLPFLGIFLH